MSLFAVICHDGGDKSALRTAHLRAHFDHVERHMARYRVAGPLKDAEGRTIGSLLIVEAVDAADAEAFAQSDPYARAGVWDHIRVSAFTGAAGEWVGGASWTR